MRDNMTNKEEAELLKQWFHDYGKPVIIAVVIGLGLGYAWRYYNQHQQQQAADASEVYQSVLVAAQTHQSSTDIAKLNKTLVTHYAKTPYASLSAFLVAQHAVTNQQWKTANQALTWVLDNTKLDSFKQLARIRLAKIAIDQKQATTALKYLNTVDDKAFTPMIDSVKGDAYSALGKTQQADVSYQAALAQYALMGVTNPLLKLKLSQ